MKSAREHAYAVLLRCSAGGAYSGQTLALETAGLDAREAALCTRLVMGVLQNLYLLDYYINASLTAKSSPEPAVLTVLRMGAYQILFMDRIPDRAAVSESVELVRRAGKPGAAGLVNAVLRRISKREIPQPAEPWVLYSHPEWFFRRMAALYGEDFAVSLMRADNEESENCLHSAFAPDEAYIQDPAAYKAVEMAGLEPGMKVLDACAAPGGKSFTAAVLMQNRGSILSCDIHEKKLRQISANAARLGIDIISVLPADAGQYNPEFASAFDAVIADVPCSGFGVLRKKPEIRYKPQEEIAGLPAVQRRIADNLAGYVKPGGVLLYSTCTVFPEENGEIARSIQGFEITAEKTFFPHTDGTDGFYACVLRRIRL